MADVTVGAKLTLDAGEAGKSVKSIRQELKLATENAIEMGQKFGLASKEAAEAAKKVAQLQDTIGDTKNLVDAFNPDTKFKAFGAALNTVVGGFSALQGALGLIGVQSDNVQKALLKVQSAMAFSQGIAQLQQGIQSFRSLGTLIKSTTLFQNIFNAATKAAAAVQVAFGIAVNTTSTAFKVLRTTIIATGIGALVVALGFLVSKIVEWTSATEDQEDAQKKLNKALEDTEKFASGKEAELDRRLSKRIAQMKLEGATEEEIFMEEQKFRRTRLQGRKSYYDEISQLDSERAKEIKEGIRDLENDITVSELNFQTKQREKAEEQAKKLAEIRAKAREKEMKEMAEETLRQNQRRAEGISRGVQITTLPGSSIEEQEIERIAATNKRFREAMAEDDEIYTNNYAELAEQRRANDEAEYQSKKSYLESGATLLSAFSALVGKETAAGKVLSIAQATINTFLGATEVLRAKSVLPEPAGTISKIANVALVIATGIAAVKNIIKTQIPGGAGGGGSVPSVSAPLQPRAPGNNSTRLDQDSLNAIGSATTRAFVLERDISSNEERTRRLNRAARIG